MNRQTFLKLVAMLTGGAALGVTPEPAKAITPEPAAGITPAPPFSPGGYVMEWSDDGKTWHDMGVRSVEMSQSREVFVSDSPGGDLEYIGSLKPATEVGVEGHGTIPSGALTKQFRLSGPDGLRVTFKGGVASSRKWDESAVWYVDVRPTSPVTMRYV